MRLFEPRVTALETRLIEKFAGAWRPIVLLRSMFRLWSACHPGEVTTWAAGLSRTRGWINTAARKEIGDGTWRTQIRRTLKQAEKSAVEVTINLEKAFDHVQRRDVVAFGRGLKYPRHK